MSEIQLANISTDLCEFVAGVYEDKCCFLEFVDRKNLSGYLDKKAVLLNASVVQHRAPQHDVIESQLREYVEGKRKKFDFPVLLRGTEFQERVWRRLLDIPYGGTMSYGELADAVGSPGGMRAVGAANGANNIAIVVPCHRVVRKDGGLQGYGGGLRRKERLLELERRMSGQMTLEEF